MPKIMPTIATPTAVPIAAPSVMRLEWDSNHFGFAVGRIAGSASDSELNDALVEARNRAFRLIYWATTADRSAPPQLLAQFGGRLVDRKVTFARALSAHDGAAQPGDLTIVPFAQTEVRTSWPIWRLRRGSTRGLPLTRAFRATASRSCIEAGWRGVCAANWRGPC
jgi:hypothetical protein